MCQNKQRRKYVLCKAFNKANHNRTMQKSHCSGPRCARPVLATLEAAITRAWNESICSSYLRIYRRISLEFGAPL